MTDAPARLVGEQQANLLLERLAAFLAHCDTRHEDLEDEVDHLQDGLQGLSELKTDAMDRLVTERRAFCEHELVAQLLREKIGVGSLSLESIHEQTSAFIARQTAIQQAIQTIEAELGELETLLQERTVERSRLLGIIDCHDTVRRSYSCIMKLVASGLLDGELAVVYAAVMPATNQMTTDGEAEPATLNLSMFEGRAPAILYSSATRKTIAASASRMATQVNLLRRGVDAASLLTALFDGGWNRAADFLEERGVTKIEKMLKAIVSNLVQIGVLSGDGSNSPDNPDALAELAPLTVLDQRVAEAHRLRQTMTGVIQDYRGFAPGVFYSDSAFGKLSMKLDQQRRLLKPDQPIGMGVDAADCLRAIVRLAKAGLITEVDLAGALATTFQGNRHAAALFAKSLLGLMKERLWVDEAGQLSVTADELSELLSKRAPRLIALGLVKTERIEQLRGESQEDDDADEPTATLAAIT